MKAIKTVGLLLMMCLSGNIRTMESTYYAEQQLITGNLSPDRYLLMIEKSSSGHARMIHALRTADYTQSIDGNYYEQLINSINHMVDVMRLNQMNEVLLRSLKFKIRRFIESYYDQLKGAKETGTVKRGKST